VTLTSQSKLGVGSVEQRVDRVHPALGVRWQSETKRILGSGKTLDCSSDCENMIENKVTSNKPLKGNTKRQIDL
jgi:hypothetical protein